MNAIKLGCLVLAASTLFAASLHDARAAEKAIEVAISPGEVATVPAAAAWTSSLRGGGGPFPPTVRLEAPGGEVVLLLSFVPQGPQGPVESSMRDLAIDATAHLATGSVEGQCSPRSLTGQHGEGAYCVFTDKRHVGKSTLPPGEFKMISSGMIGLGSSFLTFSILSNDVDSEAYRHGLGVVSRVRGTSSSSSR